jgi:hypothetical protein
MRIEQRAADVLLLLKPQQTWIKIFTKEFGQIISPSILAQDSAGG